MKHKDKMVKKDSEEGKKNLPAARNLHDEWLDVVRTGNKKQILSALKSGIDVNSTAGVLTPTALYIAVNDQVGIETVRLLIEKGADVNKKNLGREGTTPLHIAAYNEDLEICKILIENNADITILNHNHQSAVDYSDDDGDVYKYLKKHLENELKKKKRISKDWDEAEFFKNENDNPEPCKIDAVEKFLNRKKNITTKNDDENDMIEKKEKKKEKKRF